MMNMQEQRVLFADTVEKLFLDIMSRESRKSEEQRTASRGDLWQTIEENGLTAVFDPQSEGGLGGGWEDAFLVLSCAAFHSVALPIGETLLARRLLIEANMPAPNGAMTVALAAAVRLERDSHGSWHLDGSAHAVPWGNEVGHVVLAIGDAGASQLALVDSSAVGTTRLRDNVAGNPVVDLQFDNVDVMALGTARDNPFDRAALMSTASMAGALSSVLNLSVQHANERRQFGRPIGKFQAVQHSLALLANETAAVNCAALAACRAADRGDAAFEIAAAKLRANRAVGIATGIAHQVHGAIGFTREHALHRATRRLWSWRSDYGNDRYWAARLGARIAAQGAQNFWAYLTALSDR